MLVRPTALIMGARSDIGGAVARCFAANGFDLILAARRSESLVSDKADIEIRFGVFVTLVDFEVTDGNPRAFFAVFDKIPDVAVMVVGLLGDQSVSETDCEMASNVMNTNYVGPALYLLEATRAFAVRGSGTIVGIGSVAGERGRKSNFVYGSAKAGLAACLSGLRNRYASEGVHVITVKPGFVATRMTAGMKLPTLLTAQPNEVGAAVFAAVKNGRDVVYIRPIWRVIMLFIRIIPERIFKQMSL